MLKTTSQHVALKNINAARQVSLSVDLKMPKESWKKEKAVEERSRNIVACSKKRHKTREEKCVYGSSSLGWHNKLNDCMTGVRENCDAKQKMKARERSSTKKGKSEREDITSS